jgi:hypothetical protein
MGQRSLLAIFVVCLAGSFTATFFSFRSESLLDSNFLVLEPETRIVDFGEVAQKQVRNRSIRFVNRTGQVIDRFHISRGCSCNAASLDRESAEPGESVVLSLSWSVGVRRHETSEAVNITYWTAQRVQQTPQIILRANVRPDIDYNQPIPFCGFSNKTTVQTIQFKPNRVADFHISKVTTNHAAFEARLNEEAKNVEIRFEPSKWKSTVWQPFLNVVTNTELEPDTYQSEAYDQYYETVDCPKR